MWAYRLRLTATESGAVAQADADGICDLLRTALADMGVDHIRIVPAESTLDGIVFVRADSLLGGEKPLAQAIARQVAAQASLGDFELTKCELDFFLSLEIG